jgi:hypothetical protein
MYYTPGCVKFHSRAHFLHSVKSIACTFRHLDNPIDQRPIKEDQMPKTRIAGFNVENLFSRPRVLNLKDNDKVAELLAKISEFKSLIERKSYAGVEDRIVALYAELSDYIELNVRSRKEGVPREFLTPTALHASGSGDFEGFVEFRRAEFSGEQVDNTGKVIKSVKADIFAFVEVEGRTALQRFDTDILDNYFDDLIVVDGNDPRGIDVGLAAKKSHRIAGIRTNVLTRDDKPGYVFSRDCLEADFSIKGRKVTLLINHFKAKDRTPKVSDAKRKRQAEKVSDILRNKYDLNTDFVVVLGDFNDEPESDPMRPLLTTPGLHHVFDVVNRPLEDRWTYYYGSKKQRNKIDMILVSAALRPFVAGAGIERRGMADLEKITSGAEKSFPEITSWRVSASDHACVWVDLDFGD